MITQVAKATLQELSLAIEITRAENPASKRWTDSEMADYINSKFGWNVSERQIWAAMQPDFEEESKDLMIHLKNYGYELPSI